MLSPPEAGPAPPRLLLVAQTFPPLLGGSGEVHAALARHAGGAIAVLTARRDHRSGREFADWRGFDATAPHPVTRIDLIRPALGGMPRAAQVLWAWRLALAVAREARRHGAHSVCICDDDVAGWLVPFVRHVLRRRALILCHGDDLAAAAPAVIRARRRWFDMAHAVIAAGRHAADRLRAPFGVDPARIVLVSNGVALDRFRPLPPDPALRARLGLDGRRVVLAAARLVPRKGIDRLIAAWPAILARHPDAVLLVVGEGPQRPALEAMAAGLPVVFAGAVAAAEMPAHYALAEMMALPNRDEPGEGDGLPLVFLEAQACGLPVIGGRAGGTPEAIADGETGLLVDGEDAAAVAAAVIALLDEPGRAAAMGESGSKAMQSRGWEAAAARFLAA